MFIKNKIPILFTIIILSVLLLIQLGVYIIINDTNSRAEVKTSNAVWMGNTGGFDEVQFWAIIRQYAIYKTPVIQDPYGTEEEVLFFPYFYVLSWFTPTPESILILWHILKFVNIIVIVALLYVISKKLFPNVTIPFILLALFSSGFIGFFGYKNVIDYFNCAEYSNICIRATLAKVNEVNLFSSLSIPYYSFDYIVLLLLILILIELNKKDNLLLKVMGLGLGLFLLFSHPYTGIIVLGAFMLFLILKIKKSPLHNTLLIASAITISILVYTYIIKDSPVYSTLSPFSNLESKFNFDAISVGITNFFKVILNSSGIIFLVGVSWPFIYYRKKLKELIKPKILFSVLNKDNNSLILVIFVSFFCIILFGRAFSHVPLLISYCTLLTKLKKKQVIMATIIPLIFSLPCVIGNVMDIYDDGMFVSLGWNYFLKEHLDILGDLEDNSSPEEYVLCSPELGTFIPYLTGNRVYIGHMTLTYDYEKKKEEFEYFFDNLRNVTIQREFLTANNINYIVTDYLLRREFYNPEFHAEENMLVPEDSFAQVLIQELLSSDQYIMGAYIISN